MCVCLSILLRQMRVYIWLTCSDFCLFSHLLWGRCVHISYSLWTWIHKSLCVQRFCLFVFIQMYMYRRCAHPCQCTHARVCVRMLILLEAAVWQNKAQLRCPRGHVELVLTARWKTPWQLWGIVNIQFFGSVLGHRWDAPPTNHSSWIQAPVTPSVRPADLSLRPIANSSALQLTPHL